MKRLLNIFLLVLTIFSVIPNKVNADCGIGPVSIDAIISNKNGTKVYELVEEENNYGYKITNKTLKYGESIIILYESQGYASIEIANDSSEESYYIKASDYTYKSNMKAESNSYIKYYAYADTIIRNVPSFYSYEVIETIPANTYFDISGNDSYVNSVDGKWAVASYNGKKGWVYVGGCDLEGEPITITYKYDEPIDAYILGNYNSKNQKFENVTEGYKILGDDSTKENITLKYSDKVEILYKNTVGHNTYYYIKTDSIKGIWIYNTSLYEEDNINVLFEKYESRDNYQMYTFDNLKTVDITIKENEIYSSKYRMLNFDSDEAYAIDVNGKTYWIYYSYDLGSEQLSEKTSTLNLKKDYKYYSYSWFEETSEEVGIISKGEYVVYEVENTDNIFYVPKYGFIKLEDKYIANELDSNDNSSINEDVEKNEEVIIDNVISPKKFVIYCLGGTVLVALIAAITIIIIHQNKKDNNPPHGE